jgi:lipase chaperone LimK
MGGFDPGVRITRELIEANPDAALEELNARIEQSQQSGSLIAGLQARLAEQEDARHELEQRAALLAEAERRASELAGENKALQQQFDDGSAQRSSLLAGQEEALAAYRDLLL